MQHRFAKSLAGDGARVDANPSNYFTPLDKSHTLAHLGALDGRALARRSGTDNNKIVGLHRGTNLTQEACQPHQR